MKRLSIFLLAATAGECVFVAILFTAGRADDEAPPIFGGKMPPDTATGS